ncbi:MAG: DUF4957 domain-containing protein [Bacteroidia bacterium]|nr:DUF4957 domain-containing protein [Bacteroidia bacterium]
MRLFNLIYLLPIFFLACNSSQMGKNFSPVKNIQELEEAISSARPGDEIVMANGIWKDVQIKFTSEGTESKKIILRAESAGKVFIEGSSDLKIGGKYLVVQGLHFKNGHSPSKAVIEFEIGKDKVAHHCRVTDCVIEGFNKSQRNKSDLWVRFRGRHNQLDHCYLAGKSNKGPTIRVDLEGNESIKNYHKIIHNHFGPRPPKGGPSAETIQIGTSSTSMVPSYTLVANNLFDECNGEVEVISSKSNFNEFRQNIFYKSEGSLVTRHGNYCTLDGNFFIGDENNPNIGGIRLIGTGHWVVNNYFYQLKGKNFRSPLAVMNGIPKSPLNRYIQVTDVVVAHNSWINCESPWHFGVGSNVDQRDVLPPSEIRSARPIRTTVANNIIYHEQSKAPAIVAHDKLDGINFQANVMNQKMGGPEIEGIAVKSFVVNELNGKIFLAAEGLEDIKAYHGFEFERISTDLLGQKRGKKNMIGASNGMPTNTPDILDKSQYGPNWFNSEVSPKSPQTYPVSSSEELLSKINEAKDGDIIQLEMGTYELPSPIAIHKKINIQSKEEGKKPRIIYQGPASSPAFEMNPGGELKLKNIILQGSGSQFAFASLKENMSSHYNLYVDGCEVSDFSYIIKAYKYSFAEYIHFTNSSLKNCKNGLELSEETEDKGEYNAENILIDNCSFEGISQNVVDYYRGGYDESTVGGNLIISNSSFTNCGQKEPNKVLLNTYGIINVDIHDNNFTNNRVKLVALLWGAKNNSHSNNVIKNSGSIKVEQNLKLNLLY